MCENQLSYGKLGADGSFVYHAFWGGYFINVFNFVKKMVKKGEICHIIGESIYFMGKNKIWRRDSVILWVELKVLFYGCS